MMRIFRHYISRALLTLLIAEFLHMFWSIYLGQSLYRSLGAEDSVPLFSETIPSALVFVLVMGLIMTAMGLYERNFWNGGSDMLLRVAVSFMLGLFVVVAIYYLIPDLYIARGAFSLAFGAAFVGVVCLRIFFFQVSKHTDVKRRLLVLGVGQQAAQIEELERHKTSGFSVLGYIQVHEEETLSVPAERILQVTTKLNDLADQLTVDEIVVAMDDRRKGFPMDEMMDCKTDGIRISNFLTFFERQSGKIQLDALRPSNLLFAEGFQFAMINWVFKRLFDLITSLALLVLVLPVMLLTALAIWLEAGCRGKILYWQTRVGLNGHPFNVVKFRSMREDAEKGGKAVWATKGDPRITRIGAIIRDTRIDELPQLYNVLRGDMSFVGPRPERPEFVAKLAKNIPFYAMRHMVKPGITGWAQICFPYGASEEDAREKLQYDLYYIKNYSIFFDTVILLQTVHTVFWGKSAH
ncbi:MAG: TIGR03013 family PEP-CTERM/XrtA system glycosyltransferase [Candidatus Competibacteraceae bacterium]|nr:TIGR03013 family PEP-CTERM/XrtA system glycosyltransferase [Candidatus Competibacteraceae bacterium]